MRRTNKLIIGVIALTFLCAFATAKAQLSIVKRVTATTENNISFNIWIRPQKIRLGQDVILYYEAENRSPKTIYLVNTNDPAMISDQGNIRIDPPRPLPYNHGDYEFSFTEIKSGKTSKAELKIPSAMFNKGGVWSFTVGFSYVNDITGLNRRLRIGEDPIGLRTSLDLRIKTITLGDVALEIAAADLSPGSCNHKGTITGFVRERVG